MYQIQKDYRDNDTLRHSFNELAGKTFGLNFEDWYQNGFWGYQYSKKISNAGKNQLEKVTMDNAAAWNQLQNVMNKNVFHGKFDMQNNNGLILFYVTKFMQESVFYHKTTDTYIIADLEGETLFIHNIVSNTIKEIETVIELFGKDIHEVILGFVPKETSGYMVTELSNNDCTLFIKGESMNLIETEKLRIPSLSHA